jgi:CheY-like chemotaxis protein
VSLVRGAIPQVRDKVTEMTNNRQPPPHDYEHLEGFVLVVDDDESVVKLLKATLCDDGLQVETASNGAAALELIEEHEPDAIVLDLEMPVMDGVSFYRAMRARGLHIPVLVLSAYGASHARRQLGAEASLAKPFDPDVLMEQMRGLLEAGSRG